MQLSKAQVDTILKNAPAGADKKALLDGLVMRGYDLEGVDSNAIRQSLQPKVEPAKKGLIERLGDTGMGMREKVSDAIKGEGEFQDKSLLNRGIGATSAVFSAVPKGALDLAPEVVREGVDKIGDKVGEGFKQVANTIGDTELFKGAVGQNVQNADGTVDIVKGDTKGLEDKLGIASGAGEIAGTILSAEGGAKVLKNSAKAVQNTATFVDDMFKKSPRLASVPNARSKMENFLSNKIDNKTSTILKETTPENLDKFIKLADDAMKDPRKITPLGAVGDSVAEATKQLQKQTKAFSTQKKIGLSKAKVGLKDFTKETGDTILEINRKVKTPLGKEFIARLKKVKTKIDADDAIDELQDRLYTGNKDLTIPKGSMEDKALRGLLGQYNTKLKATLPKSYSVLNDKIASRIKVIDSLNTALGEVVDGVSTRGAGLVKQFFSPSGRKAQELFDYIKTNTGIDIAQDATLARFVMEMFDDARANALLEGIPKTTTGLVDKIIDVTVEKTGLGEGIQNQIRQNTLNKARGLTKPKP